MGNYTSKFFSYCEENEKMKVQTDLTMNVISNNSLHTPIASKKISVDPRSATAGITRTPIQITATPPPLSSLSTRKVEVVPTASAIPKYLQTKKYLETDVDLILPAVTPVKRILDPRSPNLFQERTPILIKSTTQYRSPIVIIKECPNVLSPEDLDPRSPAVNFDRTPILKSKSMEQADCNPRIEKLGIELAYCETTSNDNILEIQTVATSLTTTTNAGAVVTPRVNLEERINSYETEDPENDDKHANKSGDLDEENIFSENLEESRADDEITVIHNPRVIDDDIQEIPINTKSDQLEDKDAVNSATSLENQYEENKGKIVIWRDSLVSLSANVQQLPHNPKTSKNSEEITIEYEDVTPKIPKNDDKSKSQVNNEYKSKLPLMINELSIKNKQTMKKEVKGVFDEANIDINGRSRAPLATRYHKNEIDSSKSPQLVLRTKNLSIAKPAGRQQQENTPPNSKRHKSTKIKATTGAAGTHWDADKTVII